MKKKISSEDLKAWNEFITSDKLVENKDKNLDQYKYYSDKIKKIDLHGFTLEQANKEIKRLILNYYQKKIFKIIVITGKGKRSKNEENPYVSKNLSLLKYSVPDFLKSDEQLKKIINNTSEADIKNGGIGAFYIYLKKFKE